MPETGLAVKVTDAPAQIVPSLFVVPEVSAKVIVAAGEVFTVTEDEVEAEHAVAVSVTVTLYELLEAGVTTMLSEVPPCDHA
jgi:hypothetical protein